MTRGRKWLCAALMLAAAGCGDGTGPALPSARYELIRVTEQALPVVVVMSAIGTTTCVERLISRRLDFMKSGRYAVTSSLIFSCNDGRPDVASQSGGGGTYTVSEDTVVMLADAPTGGGEVTPVAAVRSGLELRLQEMARVGSGYGDFIYEVRTYVYRAVR